MGPIITIDIYKSDRYVFIQIETNISPIEAKNSLDL